jgi:hypothetical protein
MLGSDCRSRFGGSQSCGTPALVTGKCGSGPAAGDGNRIGIACSHSVASAVSDLTRPARHRVPITLVARASQRQQRQTRCPIPYRTAPGVPGCHAGQAGITSTRGPTHVHRCGVRAPDLIREGWRRACVPAWWWAGGCFVSGAGSRHAASVASFEPSQELPADHPKRENRRLYHRSATRHGLFLDTSPSVPNTSTGAVDEHVRELRGAALRSHCDGNAASENKLITYCISQ